MTQSSTVLRACRVTKAYPGTVALDTVDFDVHRGAVNVLIGENGAGKSTLVKILAGVERPTSGQLELDGAKVELGSTRAAESHGIGIIHQELSLFPNLSVVENIFMGREKTLGGVVVNRREQRRIATELLRRLEQDIDADTLVGDLPLGRQQVVEICRALTRDVKVLLMDEPTSALSPGEIRVLFRVIADLKASGVGIVYISHKLEELMEIGDYVTVLRDGHLVASAKAANVNVSWIIEKMTGRQWKAPEHAVNAAEQPALLRVRGLSVPPVARDVSFDVAPGEVVGIYGLMGAGRTEVLEALAGARPEAGGEAVLHGQTLTGLSVRERIARGVALVPEDRQRAGLVAAFSVGQNITLASLANHATGGCLSMKREESSAIHLIRQLRIKATSAQQPITALSGGNQQKAVIAKCLLTRPKLLLMDEPSRGVDVGARSEIFETMRALAQDGIAILFSSSDLHEVLELADRVLVLAQGRLTASYARTELTEARLVAAACAKPEPVNA